MPPHSLSLAAIIPALDNHDLTRQCVTTLTADTPPNVTMKVVIIDDGSRRPFIAGDFAEAILLRNSVTRGYTHSINTAVTAALERLTPDAVLLLNNDIEFRPGGLRRLVRELDYFDVVGPFGRFEAGSENRHIPFVEFSCALIRANVFAKIGLLDPRFEQGYYSDDDFCVRCGQAGFWVGQLCRANPPDIVHHIGHTHGHARRDRIASAFPIFMEKWGSSDHPTVQNYIRDYLWNPHTRGFGLLRRISAVAG